MTGSLQLVSIGTHKEFIEIHKYLISKQLTNNIQILPQSQYLCIKECDFGKKSICNIG